MPLIAPDVFKPTACLIALVLWASSPAAQSLPEPAASSLNLGLPRGLQSPPAISAGAARAALAALADGIARSRRAGLLEAGIEGSRNALIECQRGAYPGATLAAHTGPVLGPEAQPDHCFRF